MKRKNLARNALVTSILSLLLCISMLVGTTFAWFTDEVASGVNTISAGNLDVDVYYGDVANKNSILGVDELFDNVNGDSILWEPGAVAYEELTVVNLGTLALKYQMTLNIEGQNSLGGHTLSEVLKVAVLNESDVADWTDRDAVLAAAKNAAAADPGNGALSNFSQAGTLAAGANADTMYVVIFWAHNENDIDNLYNANNGQVTSDRQPLRITFGINLVATQDTAEFDSFDSDYDEDATYTDAPTGSLE